MKDYQTNWQEIVSVVVDGKDVKTADSDILKIPANTVLTGLVYEEVIKCDASIAITLKAKTAAQTFSGFTTGATDPVSGYNAIVEGSATKTGGGDIVVPEAWFTKKGDTLQIAGASALTKGRIRIGLVGFKTGMTANRLEETNQADVDPYVPPEKR